MKIASFAPIQTIEISSGDVAVIVKSDGSMHAHIPCTKEAFDQPMTMEASLLLSAATRISTKDQWCEALMHWAKSMIDGVTKDSLQ